MKTKIEQKVIEGYSKYFVRTDGTIISTKRYPGGRIINGGKVVGYPVVMLYKDGSFSREKVHRIVAKAFIPNPNNKPHVNHLNGIRDDNRVENLEWCTHAENIQHAYDTGLKKAHSGKDHASARLVLDTSTGIFYSHIKEAANAYQIPYSTLVDKLNGGIRNNTTLIKL